MNVKEYSKNIYELSEDLIYEILDRFGSNQNIDKVLKLKPEHISVYSLILEEGTKLEKIIEKEELILPPNFNLRPVVPMTQAKTEQE